MGKLTLDEEQLRKPGNLSEVTVVCNSGGETVGHFLPVRVSEKILRAWAEKPIPPEEIERRCKEPRGRSLEDVWHRPGVR